MKKTKIALLAIVASLTLVGCGGKVTPESLLKKAQAHSEEAKSAEMKMDMDMKAQIAASGMTMDMSMGMAMDLDVMTDPIMMSGTADISIEAMGQSQNVSMEMYGEAVDNKMVTYTKAEGQDWEKSESTDMTDFINMYSAEDVSEMAKSLTLEEKTEVVNDVECYKLSGAVPSEVMKSAMDTMMNSMEESAALGEMNLEGAEVPVVFYISKKDNSFVKSTIDLKGIMESALTSAMTASGVADAEITIENCAMSIDFTSYNKVEAIKIPEEAKAAN